jgi:hypothetical protein
MSYYNGKARHMSKKWRHDPHKHLCERHYSPKKITINCEFCGGLFSEKGNSKVLCLCGRDHAICYACVKKYVVRTKNIDHFRWHSVAICPDQGLKVAMALMGEEPLKWWDQELKW